MKIDEMVKAFEAVIPGYAWAWHDAMDVKSGNDRTSTKGWRDARRRNRNRMQDRCLLVYGFRQIPEDDCSISVWNRGYVELFQVAMSDRKGAVQVLSSIGDPSADYARGYFTRDATPFPARCKICLDVLGYIASHADSVVPLWQDAPDLAASS